MHRAVLETGEGHRPREGYVGSSKNGNGNSMEGVGNVGSAQQQELVLQFSVLSDKPCKEAET